MNKIMLMSFLALTSGFCSEVNIDHSHFLEDPFYYEDDLSAICDQCSQCEFGTLFGVEKLGSINAPNSEVVLFELSSFLLQPEHSYLFTLNQEKGLHFRSFKINKDGEITSWEGNAREVKVRVDQVSDGEIIQLQLFDVSEKKYIGAALTLFPIAYSLGTEGSVKFSSKSPLPFFGAEFEKMPAGEEIIIQTPIGEQHIFTIDKQGCCKGDICCANWSESIPFELRVLCSQGEFICPLLLSQSDWESKPKHDAIVVLSGVHSDNI